MIKMNKISQSDLESLLNSSVASELIKEGKLKPSVIKSDHYINGEELYQEYLVYHDKKLKAIAEGKPIPQITDKIAIAVMQICERRCRSRNFFRHSQNWKEDMIGHAIMVTATNAHKFDPHKSKFAFTYLSRVAWNAIVEQLKIERKELYVRYKEMENLGGYYGDDDAFTDIGDQGDESSTSFEIGRDDRLTYIDKYEKGLLEKKTKKKLKLQERLAEKNDDNDGVIEL